MLEHYLRNQPSFQRPVDYEWTRLLANSYQANPGEDHPKLFDAMQLISQRAGHGLAIACAEWTAARFAGLADLQDLDWRIEAAWASTLDWRYANPTSPVPPKTIPPDPLLEPIWLASLFLFYAQGFLDKSLRQVKNNGLRGMALRLSLIDSHVHGQDSPFEPWLSSTLRRLHRHFPSRPVTIDQEAPVPPDYFDPAFPDDGSATPVMFDTLRRSLDPARNPYLRSAADLVADGFAGDPYPGMP